MICPIAFQTFRSHELCNLSPICGSMPAWPAQAARQWWRLLTFLVSAYLVVSGITGFCPVKNF
jgi:hypothetical protein